MLESRSLLAGTVTWDGGGVTNEWGEAANWDTDFVPSTTHDAVIPAAFAADTILIAQTSSPNVNVHSITSAARVQVGSLVIVDIAAASTFSNGLDIGEGADLDAPSQIDISGSSTWDNPGTISSSINNHGSLSLVLDATFSTPLGDLTNYGTYDVVSVDSNALVLFGAVVNESGATFNIASGTVGTTVGGFTNQGTVAASGGSLGGMLNQGVLEVSNDFDMNGIDNSGIVNVQTGTLTISGSVAQVSGGTLTGGTWDVAGTLDLSGVSNITTLGSGAAVTLTGVSAEFASFQTVNNIQGSFNLVNHNYVGSAGAGVVNSGIVTVNGGSYGQSVVTSYSQSGGSTTLSSGALFGSTVTLTGGTFGGSGTVAGPTFTNTSATVSPGSSPGILNITGNYIQGLAGTLNIEVGGTNAGTPDFDQVIIGGSATIDGTLNVSLINGFMPDKSESFSFMTFASRSGAFATTNLPFINGRLMLEPSLTSTEYFLTGTTLIVRNTNDSGAFSLRDRIANANLLGDSDTIFFATSGTIALASPLPQISTPVTLDATTVTSYAGAPLVELNGTGAGATDGLVLASGSDDSTIKGLAINRFSGSGIVIQSDNNTISANYIGTNLAGTAAAANTTAGILLNSGASGNTIGGTTAADRNIISGNSSYGIQLDAVSNNFIEGNYIGTNAAGTSLVSNNTTGIYVSNSVNNVIGGTAAGARNVIAGSGDNIYILGALSVGNRIEGNYIGLDATGNAALSGSSIYQVRIADGSGNFVGGSATGAGNFIAGDSIVPGNYAVTLQSANNNKVQGNTIGLRANGTIANGADIGVWIFGSSGNLIGSDADGFDDANERNIISGNIVGVKIQGATSTGNTVAGNYIGANTAGTGAIPNQTGVSIQDAASNTIGGATGSNALNIISGNSGDGVLITGASSTGNTVSGNWIGLRSSSVILANGGDGVEVSGGASGNFIGTATGQNMIGGNSGAGVRISGSGTNSNTVANNYIGTSFGGGLARANATGVIIQLGAQNNKVGGSSVAERNLISGNSNSGVAITGSTTAGNLIQGNYIGVDASGSTAVANGGGLSTAGGVYVASGAHDNFIGTNGDGVGDAAEGNLISGNTPAGVLIIGSGTNANAVAGNLIGLNAGGNAAIANNRGGVRIRGGAQLNRIGTNADGTSDIEERNVISGNVSFDGVSISGSGTNSNVVAGNYLGTDITGLIAIANHDSGVSISTSAQFNRVGTDGLKGVLNSAERNVISGNTLDGVYLEDTSNNIVAGNYIGVDKTGATALANGATGILVQKQTGVSQNNRIGTNLDGNGDADERNVISGNVTDGILLTTTGTSNTTVAGNYIGVNADGTNAIPNARGIQIASGAFGNVIGGTSAAAANVISGNTVNGIQITGSGTSSNTVSGNYIGMDAANALLPSGAVSRWSADGTSVDDVGVSNATRVGVPFTDGKFGQAFDFDGVSGNGVYAPNNFNFGSSDFTVQGWVRTSFDYTTTGTIAINYYGTSMYTLAFLGTDSPLMGAANHAFLYFRDSAGQDVSLVSPTTLNDGEWHYLVALRRGQTVELHVDGALAASQSGTSLGTIDTQNQYMKFGGVRSDGLGNPQDITESMFTGQMDELAIYGRALSAAEVTSVYNASGGLNAIANGTGVLISSGASSNTIGGTSSSARNLISGNTTFGVQITGSGTSSNTISGNYIGTDVSGRLDRGNISDGIRIDVSASNNTIGGSVAGSGNLVSGNNGDGIEVNNADGNTIAGNLVGVNYLGTSAIANSQSAVLLIAGASSNTIGGTTAAARNVLSGNTLRGIHMTGAGTSQNIVIGNYVGLNAAGTAAVANANTGILISTNATNNVVGGATAAERNIISGNVLAGIAFHRAGATGNLAQGNWIGINAAGNAAMPNTTDGVNISQGASNNTIGGTAAGARNIIGGNAADGIRITGAGTSNNIIAGNYIGTTTAVATTVTAGLGSTEGNSQFSPGSLAPYHFQQVVAASDFSGPVLITSIRYRPDGVLGAAQTVNYADYRVQLSTTSRATGALSTTYADNIGVDVKTVYDAPFAMTTAFAGPAGGPKDFDEILYLTTPFLYDPADGNLLYDIQTTTGPSLFASNIDAQAIPGVWSISGTPGSATASQSFAGIAVIQFGFTPANLGNAEGLRIEAGAANNTIGGTAAGARNIISGNTTSGVLITGSATAGNLVAGNYIGADQTGAVALGNLMGVQIELGAHNNTIGGANSGSRNVISGNASVGVSILSDDNSVQGNYIGTDSTGTTELANASNGIYVQGLRTLIGGTAAGAGNVVSGNGSATSPASNFGIQVTGSSASHTVIQGNFVGSDFTGMNAIPNYAGGIAVVGDGFVTIGGAAPGARNVIAGNTTYGPGIGVYNVNATGDNFIIQGNLIGLGVDGNKRLINYLAGIIVDSSTGILIGGDTLAERNIISGAAGDAIDIYGGSGHRIQNNIIGLNEAGTSNLYLGSAYNGYRGIYVGGATNITIGGVTTGLGNVISGSDYEGILIENGGSNLIAGNLIGVNAAGNADFGNALDGIRLDNSPGNTIGGTAAGARNVISGNNGAGLNILSGSNATQVYGNLIGTNAAGNSALPNQAAGISLQNSVNDTVIGGFTSLAGTGAGNVISGNVNAGITFGNGLRTLVRGNVIGLGADGTTVIGNGATGYGIYGSGVSTIIGGDDDDDGALDGQNRSRNIISGNVLDIGSEATGDVDLTIQGNYIGTDRTGMFARPYPAGNTNGVGFNHTSNVQFGGDTPLAGNVVSGHKLTQVSFAGGGQSDWATNNRIQGNIIGLAADGITDITDPFLTLVVLSSGATNNLIGGTTQGARNIIGGASGILIDGVGTSGNSVVNNYIGTDITGTLARGGGTGVTVSGGATNNTIGTTQYGQSNLSEGGLLGYPSSVEVTNDGQIYVANYANPLQSTPDSVVRIDPVTGAQTLITSGNQLNFPNDIATDGPVSLIVTNLTALVRVNIANGAQTVVSDFTNGGQGPAPDSLYGGLGVVREASGNYLVGDYENDRILRVNAATGNRTILSSGGNLDGPLFFDLMSDGSILVPNQNNGKVVRIDAITGAQTVISSGLTEPAAIEVANDGTVYLSQTSNITPGGVYRLDLTTGAITLIAKGGLFSFPGNLGVESNGRLVVANTFSSGSDTMGVVRLTPYDARNVISGNTIHGVEITSNNLPAQTTHWWKADGTATDSAGSVTGTLQNGATYGAGVTNGQAFSFDGVDDYVDLGNSPTLDRPGTVTWSMWVNPASLINAPGSFVGRYVLGDYNAGGNYTQASIDITNNSGIDNKFSITQWTTDLTNQAVLGTTVIEANRWYHVAFVRDDATKEIRLYVDGALEGTASYLGKTVVPIQSNKFIGVSHPAISSDYFDGRIDDTAMFDRALSELEIQRIVELRGGALARNEVQGNYIGTNAAGTADLGNTFDGIRIDNNSGGNLIGGATPGAGNVISGNDNAGIWLRGGDSNQVYGNLIGVNAAGSAAVGNTYYGILVSSNNNQIGGPGAGQRNIVSGTIQNNGGDYVTGAGIALYDAGFIQVTGNVVQGNYIGTDITGNVSLRNFSTGITVQMGVSGNFNTIGGSNPGEGNVISGNGEVGGNGAGAGAGIFVNGQNHVVQILGNRIGTNATGTLAVPNRGSGVDFYQSGGNLVGGSSTIVNGALSGAGNLISGNLVNGVQINNGGSNSDGNVIRGNWIGTDLGGTQAVGNGLFGVATNASSTVIGGAVADQRNIISANRWGVGIGSGGVNNQVIGNYIGTNATGVAPLGNTQFGVWIDANGNIVGGSTAAEGNLIANNGLAGLKLDGATSRNGTYRNNLYLGNIGPAIDIGADGVSTLNDGGIADSAIDYPVITKANIVGANLEIEGFANAGAIIDIFLSGPSASGFGQGNQFLLTRVEGSVEDSDAGTGNYGPVVNGRTISTGSIFGNKFKFVIPIASLPTEVKLGAIVTAVTVGSTSEFGNATPIGEFVSNLAPVVRLPSSATSPLPGETVRVGGFFEDLDSTDWTLTVDYGDNTGVQPLSFALDRTFTLEHAYATSGAYTITVKALDNSSQLSLPATLLINVQNERPVATFNEFSLTNSLSEGGITTLRGSFTDEGAESHKVTIDWGDSSTPQEVTYGSGIRDFVLTHQYRDDGASNSQRDYYRVVVTVTDASLASDRTAEGLFLQEVVNVVPTALLLNVAPSSATENGTIALGGSFVDPGVLDTHLVTINWGDGSPEQTLSASQLPFGARSFSGITHTYLDNASDLAGYVITVSVTDDDEPLAPTSATQTYLVQNVVPTNLVVVPSATSIVEGAPISLNVSFNDPGTLDSHEVVINWGDSLQDQVISLAPGQYSITGIGHLYANDPVGANPAYPITVKLRDKDMPANAFVVSTASVTVNNVAPVVGPIQLYVRSTTGAWTPAPASPVIREGQEVRITGSFTDQGAFDQHTATVTWAAGKTTPASLNSLTKTFEATFTYTDDYAIGTAFDIENIVVNVSDGDGPASASAPIAVRVENVAPTALFIPGPANANELDITLLSQASDPSPEDFANLTYQWTVSNGTLTEGFVTRDLTFNRGHFSGVITVRLTVSDDDGGSDSFVSAMFFGSSSAESIAITDATFAVLPVGINNLTVLSLGGSDVIDARGVTNPNYNVILDGGIDADQLFGGAGDDIFILRGGNDVANDASGSGQAGADQYFLVPNSVLTIFDNSAQANALNFSLADFAPAGTPNIGVTFDLSLTNTLVQQNVAPATGATHFVAALGNFSELVGSRFGDSLTGKSGSTVDGGAGADKLYANTGTQNAKFIGGADADLFTATGSGVSGIDFQGDAGADVFTNESISLSNVIFSGGADVDTFTNISGGSISGVDFRGDQGADVFENFGSLTGAVIFTGGADVDLFTNTGSVLGSVNFQGDEGADLFENRGSLSGVIFGGGADADVFTNFAGGTISGIDFRGDAGQDKFFNVGTISGTLNKFLGGADADLFSNTGSITGAVEFGGGADADLFTNAGSITGSVTFNGGADADVFVNTASSSLGSINFQGDEGADNFRNEGTLGAVVFGGGADADLFTNLGGATIGGVDFTGDTGADEFRNLGQVLGGVIFTGGADADLFANAPGAAIGSVDFNGDTGADEFTNFGQVLGGVDFNGDTGADEFTNYGQVVGSVSFTGGADADLFTNRGGASVGGVDFNGDTGADEFSNFGQVLGGIDFNGDIGADEFSNFGQMLGGVTFNGGADADLFANSGGIVGSVTFTGGADADLFANAGSIVSSVSFSGGADADLFVNAPSGSLGSVNFNGDTGADEFNNFGQVLGGVTFTGGADADVFVNANGASLGGIDFRGDEGADQLSNFGAVLGAVIFTGGADADLFLNTGSGIASITFTGGADADVFQSNGSGMGSISFEGDEGADIFVSLGNNIGSINFQGDEGADVLAVAGVGIGAIDFRGDATDTGADTLVNRSTAASSTSTLTFYGYGGKDALRNDGSGWKIVFQGGADADVFQNNASGLSSIDFQGDAGADLFENNGNSVSGVTFSGGADADVFVNDGNTVSGVDFNGDEGADLFINTGSAVSGIVFTGGADADVFSNTGSELSSVTFNGGADGAIDKFLNAGSLARNLTFYGGGGADLFYNADSATRGSQFTFVGDSGADVFVNYGAELSGVTFSGGADADLFQNSGAGVSGVDFLGDSGADQALNLGAGLRNFRFVGGDDADLFENRADGVSGISFEGDGGADIFTQRGNKSSDSQVGSVSIPAFKFIGGSDADVFVNYGQSIGSIDFQGDAGADRLQNNGDGVTLIHFKGGLDADALQNNGDFVAAINFEGDEGADTFLSNGSNIGAIDFRGDSGADSFINTGSEIASIIFTGGADADLFRSQGIEIGGVDFQGDGGDDAMLYNSSGSSTSLISFVGGSGVDVFAFRGSAHAVSYRGGLSNDRLIFSGSVTTADLNGDEGDDRYEFAGAPKGAVTISETPIASGPDISRDTLDFSAFTAGPVRVDLASTIAQPQPPLPATSVFSIKFTDGMSVEDVIGTTRGDTIFGNDRDNYLYGAEYFAALPSNSLPSNPLPASALRTEAQWVYLDFSRNTGSGGEHVYTAAEQLAIRSRIEATYGGIANLFNLQIRTNLSAIPESVRTAGSYTTIRFNETPTYGRPGGESSEVDFGNVNLGGTASVQVNGLLGGIDIPGTPTTDFLESLPEDTAPQIGEDKPVGTSDNFVALSAKIAAHELGHLLGLRHYDSFGPIGFGIHSPPGADIFKPSYQGPAAAFETFEHIIGSPASVGSTRVNDVGPLYFGEREAIKLAFAKYNTSATTANEAGANHNSPAQAQPLSWATIAVPNTLSTGINSSKTFLVETAAVNGAITIDTVTGKSQSDYYSFQGSAGDVITIELISKALKRYTDQGANGYIDSVIRLRDSAGNLVAYYDTIAVSDDEFESSDSLLLDLKIPTNGNYTIEVDTFAREPRPTDPTPAELATWTPEAQAILHDALNDTDVGAYSLFIYRFAKASSTDGFDLIVGGGGVNFIDAGAGDSGNILIGALPIGATSNEAGEFSRNIQFTDFVGSSWTITVDYGEDLTNPILAEFSLTGNGNGVYNLDLAHTYNQDGVYLVKFTISNNAGASVPGFFVVQVNNVAPELDTVLFAPTAVLEGGDLTVDGVFLDQGFADTHIVDIDWGDGSAHTFLNLAANISSFAATHSYADDNAADAYSVKITVFDGAATSDQFVRNIQVNNVAPTAVQIVGAPGSDINESSTPILLTSRVEDPGIRDIFAYSWVVTRNGNPYQTSSSPTLAFLPTDNGDYLVSLTVTDDDGGSTQASEATIHVNNVAPNSASVLLLASTINENGSTSLSGAFTDPGTLDTHSVTINWGDGSPLQTLNLAGGVTAIPTTLHTYADNGIYSIGVTITDKDNASTAAATTVTVNNAAPTALFSSNGPITYGETSTVSFSNQHDDSGTDTSAGFHYAYSLTSDFSDITYTSGSSASSTYDYSGLNAGNYVFYARIIDKDGGYSQYQTSVSVGQRFATIVVDQKSKAYGDANPTLTATIQGTINGDILGYTLDTTATEFSNVGVYGITVTLGANSNYSITPTGAALTIGQRSAMITAVNKTKVYGEANPALTATIGGAVNGDSLSYTLETIATQFSNVGGYGINVLLGSNPNYSIISTFGELTIDKRSATVTANNNTRIYGDANPALTATIGGTLNGDSLNYTLATAATPLSNVGAPAITISLGMNPNYTVITTDGTLTITPRAATVTAVNATKIYGDANPTLTTIVNGTVNNDSLNYTLETTATQLTSVGSPTISVALGSNPNYTVTSTAGVLTITPRSATVTADSKTKTYGDTNPALTAVVTGMVNGDSLSYVIATTATQFSHARDVNYASILYPITFTSVASNPNYTITSTASTLTIAPRSATVTADPKTKTYGEANSALSATVGGIVNSDSLNYTLATTATQFSNVGTSAITVSLASNPNYTVTPTAGTLTITPRAATITAVNKTKTYGDANPTLTATVGGTVNSDSLNYTLATTATQFSNAGSTNPITVTLGSPNANYSITSTAGTLTVEKANQTITWANPSAINYGTALSSTQLNATVVGISGGTAAGGLTYSPAAGTVLAAGTQALTVSAAATTNYNSATKSVTLVVNAGTTNTAPTVTIGGSPDDADRGVASIYTFTATDADAVDRSSGHFVFIINWGDGTSSTATSATGANSVNVSKTYNKVSSTDGVYTITATARDARGATGNASIREIGVLGWSTYADPINPGKAILVVVGSQGPDDIKLKEVDCDNIRVTIRERDENARFRGTVDGDVDRILIYGLAGDDKITIDDDINTKAEIWGGAGNDKIKGGGAADIILGELGNDTLYGGDGRDLLIGGAGADAIHGDDNDDILIAGYTTFDKDRRALEGILAEWASNRSYSDRRSNIMGAGSGTRANGAYYLIFDAAINPASNNTVFDDGVADTLWGDDGRDWFMYQADGDHGSVKDIVKDKSSNENGDDIDKWW